MLVDSPPSIVPFKFFAALGVSLTGLGSWIVVNGLWYEIPLLVNVLPESWNLPAYLSLFIQLANIGPLVYVLLTKLCRRPFCGRFPCLLQCLQPPERLANYVILLVGLISCILLANFWDVVLPLPGISDAKHSVVLLTLALSAATVDCISTVTFITYLTGMPSGYIASLSFGEALSDLLPSSLALIQGIGENVQCVNETVNETSRIVAVYPPPRFPEAVFLYGLATIMAISLAGFTMLDISKFGLGHHVTRRFHQSVKEKLRPGSQSLPGSESILSSVNGLQVESADAPEPVTDFLPPRSSGTQFNESKDVVTDGDSKPTLFQLMLPVLLLCYASMLSFGFLPALQSYSSAAYNPVIFHLSVNLSGLGTALLALLITWLVYRRGRRASSETLSRTSVLLVATEDLKDKSLPMVTSAGLSARSVGGKPAWAVEQDQYRLCWLLLSGFLLLPSAYVIYLASTSPNPPHLAGIGPVLAVIAWILIRAGFSGLRTWLWLFMTTHCHDSMTIRLTGLLSQLGSAVGAVLSFLLVVQYEVFVIKQPCG